MVENPNLVLQATWFEAATYLHGEGRVRVCEDFFMSALSRGFEDHQRTGRTCGRKELSVKLGTDFLAHVVCHLSPGLECLANISVPPLQVSLGHWRRLGKLFVHGQLRQTFLPEAEDDLEVMLLWSTSVELLFVRCRRSFVPTAWRTGRGSLPRDSAPTAGN